MERASKLGSMFAGGFGSCFTLSGCVNAFLHRSLAGNRKCMPCAESMHHDRPTDEFVELTCACLGHDQSLPLATSPMSPDPLRR